MNKRKENTESILLHFFISVLILVLFFGISYFFYTKGAYEVKQTVVTNDGNSSYTSKIYGFNYKKIILYGVLFSFSVITTSCLTASYKNDKIYYEKNNDNKIAKKMKIKKILILLFSILSICMLVMYLVAFQTRVD